MFIQRSMMRNMVISVERNIETLQFAMLWLVSYTFLLRVPSEALPIVRGDASTPIDSQAVLYLEDENTLALQLKCRKNKPRGGTLRRGCVCNADRRTCPVHALWHQFLAPMEIGTQPWINVSSGEARSHLRATLERLAIPNAEAFGTHDLRRGHARDMQLSGASLAQILAAGEWKSRAVASYVDLEHLEHDLALEAAMHSDQDDCDWIE